MNQPSLQLPELSVFFPCYNEEENVEALLTRAVEVFPQFAAKIEILIIDDGSTDETANKAALFAQSHPVVRIIRQKHGGYGRALRRGFDEAVHEYVFFADGDLQFDLKDFARFVPEASRSDLVIGYRLRRADGIKRVITQKMLKVWAWIFLKFPLSIKDTNCAFKLFKRTALRSILPLQSEGAIISTELLLRAHRAGLRITQIGVHHLPRIHGEPTGQRAGVILKAVRETFALRAWLR